MKANSIFLTMALMTLFSVNTNAQGSIQTPRRAGNTSSIRGDVNNDGVVNSADVIEVVNIIMNNGGNNGGGTNGDDINDEDISELTWTIKVGDVSFTMVGVGGGTFQMGDNNTYDKPVHEVSLSSFCIGQTEVTQNLWYAVMGYKPTKYGSQWSSYLGMGDTYPVYYVSWDDCQEFIAKLNEMTGLEFRMPTEAEWEFAARGGKKSKGYKYSGSNAIADVAWYKTKAGLGVYGVARKEPNELGIFDMTGNVYEWCSDWYGNYTSDAQINPTGPETGERRVYRGGSTNSQQSECLVSYRSSGEPEWRGWPAGLRLVVSGKLPDKYSTSGNQSDDEEEEEGVQKFTVGNVSFKMVRVDGGTFQMGGNSTGVNDASPVHQVSLTTYSIGQTEVTQALWTAVMGQNSLWTDGVYDDLPAYQLSWNDCQDFIAKLNEMTGQKFRMPTEAEWEYAARGGSKSQGYLYSGGNYIDDVAWYADNSSGFNIVAKKQPNELGIYDMSGNVYEWCNDWYDIYTSDAQFNPTGPSSSGTSTTGIYMHVMRGGSSFSTSSECVVSARSKAAPSGRTALYGLRLAL